MAEGALESEPTNDSWFAFAHLEQPNNEGGSVIMWEEDCGSQLRFFGGRVNMGENLAEAMGRLLFCQLSDLCVPAGAGRVLMARSDYATENVPIHQSTAAKATIFGIAIASDASPLRSTTGRAVLIPKDLNVIWNMRDEISSFAYNFLLLHISNRDASLINIIEEE